MTDEEIDPREEAWEGVTVTVNLWDLHLLLALAHCASVSTIPARDIDALNRINDAHNDALPVGYQD